MSSFAKFSAVFVEGATTSVKAGAKVCYIALTFILLSAVGMMVSQMIENKFDTCERRQMSDYVAHCMTEYLNNAANWSNFRMFLRLFDVAGSILLIAVGNCLENVFRNTVMARVMNGTLLIANIMVVFETCFNSGLSLQLRDFVKKWSVNSYSAYLISCYVMMDHAFDLIWTLDNTLYAYFMVLLGFLTSEHDKFSAGYTKTAFLGGILGLVSFIAMNCNFGRWGFVYFIAMICQLVSNLCFVVLVGWTGKALSQMEGDLVGKKGKKGKKSKKSNRA